MLTLDSTEPKIVILDKSKNYLKMKNLLIFLLISTTSFAQNKKEQIEILNFRVDSLNTVLSATRDNSTKDISVLNDNIKEISNEVTALKSDLTNLQTSNNMLTSENIKLKTDLTGINLKLSQLTEYLSIQKAQFQKLKDLTIFKIGDKVFGGVIIKIDESGKHGLIMTLQDQGEIEWFDRNDVEDYSEEDGHSTDWKSKQLEYYGIAYEMCKNLIIEGYNDWRLPKDNELTWVYTNGKKFLSPYDGYYLDEFSVNFFLKTDGHVCYNLIDNEQVNYYRGDHFKVRAVREF